MKLMASSTMSVLSAPLSGPTRLPSRTKLVGSMWAALFWVANQWSKPKSPGRRLGAVELAVEVPLAREAGRVAGVLEQLGDGHLGAGQVDARVLLDPVADADPVRVPAGEQGGPRGRADRGAGVEGGEADPLASPAGRARAS